MSGVPEICRRPLTVILVLGLAIRLVLMPLLTFELDLGYWLRITGMLDAGFGLYDTTGYYYTPIWGYIVAVFSYLGSLIGISDLATFVPELTPYISGVYIVSEYVVSPAYAVMMKIPIVMADTVTAYLLYDLVKYVTSDTRKAVRAFALWYLCPFVILVSSVHGMFDSISAMLILLTICLIVRRNYFLGGAAFALSVLTKFFPLFFIFFLVAYVLRREGIDGRGLRYLLSAVAGSLAASVAVLLPAALNGQLWESLFFLTDRLGISSWTMDTSTVSRMILALILIVCAVCVVGYVINRWKGAVIRDCLSSIDPKVRDRRVKIALLCLGVVVTAAVVTYTVLSFEGTDDGVFLHLMISLGMRGVMLLSIFTLIIEVYIAYLLLVSDTMGHRTVFSLLAASSLVVFLWPPLPQYAVVIVPFLVLYIVSVNDGFGRPFMAFSLVLFIYEALLINASSLFSLSVYTNLIPFDIPLSVTEWASGAVLGIPISALILGVLSIAEYLVMFNMVRFWYTNKEVSDDA